jgi:para-aminobenzoate synthetase/4-amino-4-deoxychorismate lyase
MIILQDGEGWRCFDRPVEVVTAVAPADVLPALRQIETAVNEQQRTAVGYISYEASPAFQLASHPATDLPLLWFGLFDQEQSTPDWAAQSIPYTLTPWQPAITEAAYHAAISQIKTAIAQGHTYQVNYTFPLHATFQGDPLGLFADLVAAQPGGYAAYLDMGRFAICSVSPELFFALNGRTLHSKPMKGTAKRGRTLAEDEANRTWLAQSEKNRAENVMIVDMIRNDMGRIADVGSVRVTDLFAVERYPTLLQMTSTVQAQTDQPVADILAAMFPCASITGAPKRRTMQLIQQLEPYPRGVYTGAIGYIAPGRRARFSVAIRTVLVDRQAACATYGVGSGIVWDSTAVDEYAECRLKTRVLTMRRPRFDLLESLLWQPGSGYFLLDGHLRRLGDTAVYWQFPFDEAAIRQTLAALEPTLSEACKVRLTVGANGRIQTGSVPLAAHALPHPVRVGLAAQPVDATDPLLFHKTTYRSVYDAARASRPECDEVILWNGDGWLTEAGSSNLVLALDGRLLTPPVAAGLLPGVMRQYLLDNRRIQEAWLTKADLARADQIYLINSVRKWLIAVSCEL